MKGDEMGGWDEGDRILYRDWPPELNKYPSAPTPTSTPILHSTPLIGYLAPKYMTNIAQFSIKKTMELFTPPPLPHTSNTS
ncbi:hypothetical protein AYI68_g4024 [Smittium mucronatum]|uniref:Uncharacterized protein n=1 Tax=Smittium mucronatum TaxID=133383 RepID=A0A1R0GYE2_9FUNG|nr:hypothetical protein AYI68_g4024 [Smittium mucronatum]